MLPIFFITLQVDIMYSISSIQTCLFGRVGFRSSPDPAGLMLNASVSASASGLYVNDIHPLLTAENIDQTFPQFSLFTFPAWAEGTTYPEGSQVSYSDKVYECIETPNVGNQPNISPDYWEEMSLVSDWLEVKMKQSIANAVRDIMATKKARSYGKTLLENVRLYSGTGRINNVEIPKGRFVGFELVLKKHNNIRLVLEKIGMQFSQKQTALTIYLYHSSQASPIVTQEITTTEARSFSWTELTNFILEYASDYDAGGSYYIGYFEDDISGNAIIKEMDWSAAGRCATCNAYDSRAYSLYNKYFDVIPFYVNNPTGTDLWDIANNSYDYYPSTNFGLNLEISASCDISDLICQQKALFDELIQMRAGIDILNEMIYGTRNNEIAKKVRAMNARITLDIMGDRGGGMENQYKILQKAVDFDFSGIDRVCLPCSRRTLKMGAM